MLTESGRGRSRSGAPIPLGAERLAEQAVKLRAGGLTYTGIALVMREYHGAVHSAEWWARECRARGSAPKYHGSHAHLRLHLFEIDHRVLEALDGCPLTVLQLLYRLKMRQGALDKLDRSLHRLVRVGRIEGTGAGLERRWSVK